MDRVKVIGQKRTNLKAQVTHLANLVESNKNDKTNLQMRLKRITELLHAYEDLHDELAIIDPENEHLNDFQEIQDRYYEIASKIETMEVAGSSRQANDTLITTGLNATFVEKRRTLKLPIAELPKFGGNLDKWLSYKNTFLTMIDGRTDITDLEKFLYLKTSLRGDALNKVLVFDASAENYQNAWRLLVDSYEKRRILVSKHINAILDMGVLSKATPAGLAKLIDDVRQHLNMLQSLGVTPDSTVIVHILERALPTDIRQKWEESLDLDVIPTLDQFYKFINETTFRMVTLEQASSREKIEKQAGDKRRADRDLRVAKIRKTETSARAFVTAISNSCAYCNRNHPIYKCPTFERLSTSQRWDAVKRKRLCRNCLRSHVGECKASRCRHCGRFHNSLLHSFATQPSAVQSTSQSKPENVTTSPKKSL